MAGNKKSTRREENTQIADRLQRPRKYKVIMLNDDYTPMNFVVHVLEQIFFRTPAESTRIMLRIHRQGLGVAGVYSREIAETKRNQTIQIARERGYPLMLETEPE